MINLRFRALNPKVHRKAERVYDWWTTFSPSTINRYFMAGSSGDKNILWGLSPGYGYFSGGSSEIQKDFLAPDFYLNCFFLCFFLLWRCPHGVRVKAMDCGIIVSELVLQSCYYIHFQANTLGKGMNSLILPVMGTI